MKGFTKGKGKGRKFIPTTRKSQSLSKDDMKKFDRTRNQVHEANNKIAQNLRQKKTIEVSSVDIPDFTDVQEAISWLQRHEKVSISEDERKWKLRYFKDNDDSEIGMEDDERLLRWINDEKNRWFEEGNTEFKGKQRMDLIPHQSATWQMQGINYGMFEGMSPEIGEELLTGHPNIDPNEKYNHAPTGTELVALAKKYNGTLGGFYIGEQDTSRDDHRITLETLHLPIDENTANALRDEYYPDEFSFEKDTNTYRFWWD